MALETGARLGRYEVVSRIGAGGLGEVWRAHDPLNDRSVAIKVLPREFGRDAWLRARFEREAKVIAKLEHPNLCSVLDVGDNYLVMELLEGESLATRLNRGALSIGEVTALGAQLAEALDKVHTCKIVHRDVNPRNIMITSSGVKLLDLGLARWEALLDMSDAITLHKPTRPDSVGASALRYLSPEQLNGAEVDARGDVFSLGTVLYEMTTGSCAFPGTDTPLVIGAILRDDAAPVRSLRPDAPLLLERAIMKCLEKRRSRRWQSAADLADVLRWVEV